MPPNAIGDVTAKTSLASGANLLLDTRRGGEWLGGACPLAGTGCEGRRGTRVTHESLSLATLAALLVHGLTL